MTREVISTEDAPRPAGPYSQAVVVNGFLYTSGILPVDSASGRLITGEPEYQTTRALKNLQAICSAAGTQLAAAARVTIYARNVHALPQIDRAYSAFFDGDPPARVVIGVSELPLGDMCGIEIEAVVPVKSSS